MLMLLWHADRRAPGYLVSVAGADRMSMYEACRRWTATVVGGPRQPCDDDGRDHNRGDHGHDDESPPHPDHILTTCFRATPNNLETTHPSPRTLPRADHTAILA